VFSSGQSVAAEGHMMIAATDIDRIIGSEAVDQDNDKIGKVSQVYLDTDSERPTWATVKTGLFGTSETLVPLDDANWDEGTLHLAVDKARVKGAPRVDPDAELSVDAQKELYAYYGFTAQHGGDDGRRNSGNTGDSGLDRSAADTDAAAGSAAAAGAAGSESGRTHRSGGAHVAASVDGGPETTAATTPSDSNASDGEGLSYSRSDSNTSDLDAGVPATDRSNDSNGAGVVGTAADRTIGGPSRGQNASDSSSDSDSTGSNEQSTVAGLGDPDQGEVRLRRYIVVEETVVTPRSEGQGSNDTSR
jgi:hypothetical protein